MPAGNATASDTAAREIVATRVFDAPRDLVFRMWTDPVHIAQWWGPKGFTNTIYKMDVRPGGVWEFVMHGPDGVDYKNRFVYDEVVSPERIAYTHKTGPLFHAIVDFVDQGEKTAVTVRMVFESAELKQQVVTQFGAVEGLEQTLSKLGDMLATADPAEFVITRVFDAPRDVVFRMWTEREHMLQWFGPKGFPLFECTIDLRPGGVMHYGMRMPEMGGELWGKWIYREIVPPERLSFVMSFSDAEQGVTRHPMAPVWPLETLSIVTFMELDGQTTVTMQGIPINATEEERAIFMQGRSSMQMGWTGTLDQLEAYLTKEQS
jgi:uncharacterized protein YndB with AHSA1/START domain